MFVANSRAWASPPADAAADEAFGGSCADAGLPVFVHAPYLINLGSPAPETLARSVRALEYSLRRGAVIGATGVVVHAGSATGNGDRTAALAQVREHLLPVLDSVARGPRLLIEPTAGGGGALAAGAASLAEYLDALDGDDRVGVCVDTCHMHAAGHDLSTREGFAHAVRGYAAAAGRGGIGLVHVNDSRDPAGSLRDRHASVGAGTIGRDAFAALFTAHALRGVALVVETRPAEQAGDIAALKELRDAHRASGRARN